MTQVYEGTPEQLVKQLSKLPSHRKYKVTVTPAEPEHPQGTGLRRGMFPQLRGLTEEDFKAVEWRGEDIDL